MLCRLSVVEKIQMANDNNNRGCLRALLLATIPGIIIALLTAAKPPWWVDFVNNFVNNKQTEVTTPPDPESLPKVQPTPEVETESEPNPSKPLQPEAQRLSEEVLQQKCQNGDVPKTILIPKKEEYFETEMITVEYANACPNRTSLVVKRVNSPTTGMNTGHLKRRIIVREYAGELSLDKGDSRFPNYEIHAYFNSNPNDVRVQDITGVSKSFKIVPRI